ncbi:MAG: cytochrome c-type biogenesis protein CcmH [Bryobacteraceae bacterium]
MSFRIAALFAAALAACAGDHRARIETLEKSVLAPCCYKDPVSRHQSDASTKVKLEIRKMVEEGKSDGEILATFRQRYGDKVVITPEKDPSPWVVATPWLAGLAGAALVGWILRAWRKRAPAPPV